jgi:cytochrome P450
MAAITLPPGPHGHWLSGSLPEIRRGWLEFLERNVREFGDVLTYRVGPKRLVLISHPDDIEEVLVTRNCAFKKLFALRMNSLTFGEGLLTSEGDFWRRQRRLAQPAFHRARIQAYAQTMVAYTERLLAGWRDGETRDVHADMMRLTLEIVAKALFDAEAAAEADAIGRALAVILESFVRRFNQLSPLPERFPTPANLRLQAAVRRLDRIVYRYIRARRAEGADRGDLLSMLIAARDEDGRGGMSDRQLRDELVTIILAGHETTAIALSWTWYLLAQNPEAEAKLHAELDAVLGDRPPTLDDLPRLPYTDWVIQEALRLYPPVYAIGRDALEDISVAGYRLRAGTTVLMSQWVVHRDPRYFDQPDCFRPERWADGLADRLPKYAYFPFGGGPRLCIGNNFARMEAALILATVARRYRLRLAPGGPPIRPWPSLTLRPSPGVPARLEER